jgi:acetyl-CoA/propionyl-CoA carboxylase biotin carboxyl carrier protein
VTAGSEVTGLYDPLLAKLVVHDVDREQARRRMLRALGEFEIGGVTTLIGFHRALLAHDCFVAGKTCRDLVGSPELAELARRLDERPAREEISGRPLAAQAAIVEVDGRRVDVEVHVAEPPYRELGRQRHARGAVRGRGRAADEVRSPMQGTVLEVRVSDGDEVGRGTVICIVEAMKMENEIAAHRDGTVTALTVAPGDSVSIGQIVCVVLPDGREPAA